jgi:hypothetical protein
MSEPHGGARSFTRRTATPADAESLIGLFNRAFHKSKDAATASWKYFGNPHGRSFTLLAEDDAKVGGAYSYVFRRAAYRGRPFLAAQASDAMVDVDFRRRGIFTAFDDDAAADAAARGVPVCMAVAGRQSMHGFLKNGWRAIGTYRQYLAVLDPAALLRSRLGPLAGVAAAPLSLLLALSGRRPARAPVEGIEVGVVGRFEPWVDQLFARVAPELPIVFARDAEFLNWRFVDNPTRKHRILVARRGGEPVGYAVIESGAGRGYVVDLLADGVAAEDALLRAALARFAAEGCGLALLSTLPCERLARALRRNGFFPHPRKTPFRTATPFIVRVLREDLDPDPDALLDPTQWYVLDGDRDVEHVSPA